MIKKISRVLFFLKRYIKYPLYIITYACTYFLRDFSFKIQFYTDEEIISLLKKGKSIIRLGDGEISTIPLGLENCCQTPNSTIKKMLRRVIREYSVESPYVLSVPRFLNTSNSELRGMNKLHLWMPVKVMFLLRFNKNVPYMDAHNFYYDNYIENVISPIFKDKTVILVTKKETIEKHKNNPNIPWSKIGYVETPEKEALLEYENIKRSIDREINDLSPNNVVLFFAMGPVGKYIIFEYANRGYQCIDVGRGLEVMFTGESIEHLSI